MIQRWLVIAMTVVASGWLWSLGLALSHSPITILAMSEPDQTSIRKILHVDMDAFFASVEQRDDPRLRGRPVAVGGSEKRGVVAAASYEARQFGVHSAMPSSVAVRRCPQLIFAPARFDVYRSVSQQIREIFRHYSDLVEPLSLDEAYLDVTDDKQCVGSAVHTAQRVRAAIKEQTGLTASAGVSYNKFLAKIASDQNKPDGIFVIRPGEGADFVATLPVRRFYGVGPRRAERMSGLGIHLGADLRTKEMDYLYEHFGKSADYLYHASRGIDHREVKTNRVRKSVGRERTYKEDLKTEAQLREALEAVTDSVWQRIEDNNATGRTVTLKVKYADFRQITRSQSSYDVIAGKEEFAGIADQLLRQIIPVSMGVRLLGLTLSSLISESDVSAPSAVSPQIAEQGAFEF